jgi:hypothetical protein
MIAERKLRVDFAWFMAEMRPQLAVEGISRVVFRAVLIDFVCMSVFLP